MKQQPKLIVTIFGHEEQSYLESRVYEGPAAKQFLRNMPNSWMFESRYKHFENYYNSKGDNIQLEFIGF